MIHSPTPPTHTHFVKELAHMVVEVGKFKICRIGQKAGHPGEGLQFESKVNLLVEFLFHSERSALIY